MSNELSQFLETSVVTEEPEAIEPEVPETADKGEQNAETPSAEKGEPTATDSPAKTIPIAAQIDERRKRQEIERERDELKQQLEALKTPKQEEKGPDLFADPEGWTKAQEQKTQKQILQTKIEISREMYLDSKPDFEEKEAAFVKMAQANPSLVQQMYASANPAKFAYETAKKQLAIDAMGDPETYREKLKAEILAELQGGTPEPEKPVKAPLDKAPSLATASAAKLNTDLPDDSLESKFKR
jgi:hypothetical protein